MCELLLSLELLVIIFELTQQSIFHLQTSSVFGVDISWLSCQSLIQVSVNNNNTGLDQSNDSSNCWIICQNEAKCTLSHTYVWLCVCFSNLLVDDVDPCGGAVAEVGPLQVPQSLGPLTGEHSRPCTQKAAITVCSYHTVNTHINVLHCCFHRWQETLSNVCDHKRMCNYFLWWR